MNKKRNKTKSAVQGARRWLAPGWRRKAAIGIALLLPLAVFLGIRRIDSDIREAMEGPNWDVPSVIFAEPVKLYAGQSWGPDQVESLLQDLSYTRVRGAPNQGTYEFKGGGITVFLRALEIPSRRREPLRVTLEFAEGEIADILDPAGVSVQTVETEAPKVAGFYGRSRQARDPIKLAEVPAVLRDAVILVEDKRFHEHAGIDPRGILRALWADIRAVGMVQGGSTITQQLAKNLFLSNRKTVTRKVSEMFYAKRFERLYPKEAILEAYLNEVYLGASRGVQISGMKEGARHYFGLDVRDLKLPQAALLAGLIRSPGSYDPFRKPDEAKARRRVVLDVLLTEGKISQQERDAADKSPLGLRKAVGLVAAGTASYVDAIRSQLAEFYPGTTLETAGLRIFTPLDPRVQAAAQDALDTTLPRIEKWRKLPPGSLQGAVVVLEPGTGAVRALVGGREWLPGSFNRAIEARRQPGSLMKPFVYAAALESKRFTPATLLDDSPIELTGKDGLWTPSNADGLFRGPVTFRRALEESLNVPSVRVVEGVGPQTAGHLARRAGIVSPLVRDYTVVLGTGEVTPLEMASAFATFASGGIAAEPRYVSAVISRSGEVLHEKGMKAEQVISPDVVFLLNDLLRGACLRGTAQSLSDLAGRYPLSGKTGTTTGGRDAWFVGYTPRFLALVWVGPDEPKDLRLSGAGAALPVWRRLAELVPRYLYAAEPEPPEGLLRVQIDPTTGMLGSNACPELADEWFLEGTEPTEVCHHATGGTVPAPQDPQGAELKGP